MISSRSKDSERNQGLSSGPSRVKMFGIKATSTKKSEDELVN